MSEIFYSRVKILFTQEKYIHMEIPDGDKSDIYDFSWRVNGPIDTLIIELFNTSRCGILWSTLCVRRVLKLIKFCRSGDYI